LRYLVLSSLAFIEGLEMSKPLIVRIALVVLTLTAVTTAQAQAPQPDPKSPQYRATGEQDRTYTFPGTGESIAYHIYVPTTWNASVKLPLVIVTHGANQPATAPFQRPMADPTLAKTAESRRFIVAAVTGYHANATAVGGWNVPYKMVQVQKPGGGAARGGQGGGQGGGRGPAAAPPAQDDFARAEMDVLYVTDLMAKEYNVDPARTYLMGNSSGGSAVWTYAARYPERWTAIAPSAAPLEDETFPYEKLKTVPVLVIHGDMDTTMLFSASEAMVAHAKAKGVNATWLPVPGGAHTDAWAQPAVISQIFDFFDAHRTKLK
jgi:poly(3-hydroxybutyrate) depolymerase